MANSSRLLVNLKGKGNPDLPLVCSNYRPPTVALSLCFNHLLLSTFRQYSLQTPQRSGQRVGIEFLKLHPFLPYLFSWMHFKIKSQLGPQLVFLIHTKHKEHWISRLVAPPDVNSVYWKENIDLQRELPAIELVKNNWEPKIYFSKPDSNLTEKKPEKNPQIDPNILRSWRNK